MIKVSVIIVTYHSDAVIKQCLASIPKQDDIEVIVIDNTKKNRGFGKACNVGASKAKGEYLFFLNPDTVLKPNAINILQQELENNASYTIVAPQLLDEDNHSYLSFTKQAKYSDAWVVFSPLNRLFQDGSTVKSYWYHGKSLDKSRNVGSVSGAACMMRAKDFRRLEGFDETFFMYWEDADLCRRVIASGGLIRYVPQAKVIHQRGGSTPAIRPASRLFKASRLRFFIKHFGIFKAYPLEVFIRLLEVWRITLVALAAVGLLIWLAQH